MPAVSKAKRQRIDAGKNSCDVRSKEKENNEENETWKRKQQEVPKAMVMMYTDNFQDTLNNFQCKTCGSTGAFRVWLGLKYRIQNIN